MLRTAGKHFGSGLDNGDEPRGKKRKRNDDAPKAGDTNGGAEKKDTPEPEPQYIDPEKESIKILPGERMSDFKARVDRSMPIAGLSKRNTRPLIPGVKLKERETAHTKNLKRIQKAWREEEAKIREKEQEAEELAQEEEEEKRARWGDEVFDAVERERKGRKKGGKKGEDDPWSVLNSTRQHRQGINDIVHAPPTLKKPRERFKIRQGAAVDVADVPATAGSLKKREELGAARKDIIGSYRKIMGGKRAVVA